MLIKSACHEGVIQNYRIQNINLKALHVKAFTKL